MQMMFAIGVSQRYVGVMRTGCPRFTNFPCWQSLILPDVVWWHFVFRLLNYSVFQGGTVVMSFYGFNC